MHYLMLHNACSILAISSMKLDSKGNDSTKTHTLYNNIHDLTNIQLNYHIPTAIIKMNGLASKLSF